MHEQFAFMQPVAGEVALLLNTYCKNQTNDYIN